MAEMAIFTGVGIGVMLIGAVFGIGLYVLHAVAHMKALKALGYPNPWMAWIPYASNYAYADCVVGNEEKIRILDSFEVPAMVLKLWWVVLVAFLFLPLNPTLERMGRIAMNIIFLGSTYTKMYARLDGRTEQEEQPLGIVSGFIPLIAVVKFLTIK